MSPFVAHLRRHEAENVVDKFASAPPGTFERLYTAEGLRKRLDEPGWVRVWVVKCGRRIVGHASLYDLGEPDLVVFGHIGVERDWRGWRLAAKLQTSRLRFCDEHGLTLVGAIALGNDASWFGCRRNGFQYLGHNPENGETTVFRPPVNLDGQPGKV